MNTQRMDEILIHTNAPIHIHNGLKPNIYNSIPPLLFTMLLLLLQLLPSISLVFLFQSLLFAVGLSRSGRFPPLLSPHSSKHLRLHSCLPIECNEGDGWVEPRLHRVRIGCAPASYDLSFSFPSIHKAKGRKERKRKELFLVVEGGRNSPEDRHGREEERREGRKWGQ